jgi:hypothetical protein
MTDAVLTASRLLVAVSARSIAAVDEITIPQFRLLVVFDTRGPLKLSTHWSNTWPSTPQRPPA